MRNKTDIAQGPFDKSILSVLILVLPLFLGGWQVQRSIATDKPHMQVTTFHEVGEASWYGPGFHGQKTASGETFNENKLTAAHPTLPLGTKAQVTDLETGKSVEVVINDRASYVKNRVIDLSKAAAQELGMTKKGTTRVKIEANPNEKADVAK